MLTGENGVLTKATESKEQTGIAQEKEEITLAYSAAKAVVKLLGSAYNPLFIYGESGTGKTHLLYSIKNELSKNGKDIKVYYTTFERVIDEFSSCKQNVDVLLIDNFQLFNGKYEIQDELITILDI